MKVNKYGQRYSVINRLPIVSLLFIVLLGGSLTAQTNLQTHINFSATNEQLSRILYRLANETNINFTYNAGDDVFAKKISYKAVDKLPLIILDELLSNTNHTFKQIGNQIVIYKKNSTNNTAVKKSDVNDKKVSERAKIITDTIFVVDTIVVAQIDTVLIMDTVFVERKKFPKPIVKLKEVPVDNFAPNAYRKKGWSAGAFITPILSNFSLVQNANSLSFRNFSFGFEASKIINKWNITAGLKLTHFSEKINSSYDISNGGYFVKDTVDAYYTVTQLDTSWYYITDSTWKPINNHKYSYDITNRVGYFEVNASLSFDYISNKKYKLYAKAGIQSGILIYKNGVAITNPDNPVGVNFADLNFRNISISVFLGTGIKYRLNKQMDFNSEIYYLNYFNNVVSDYPTFKKIQGVGFKFGLTYYF